MHLAKRRTLATDSRRKECPQVGAVPSTGGKPSRCNIRRPDRSAAVTILSGCSSSPSNVRSKPRVHPVSLPRAQYERVRLLLRPVRHVGRAYIACKYLCTGDLRDSINTQFRTAACGIPLKRPQNLFFEQRSKSATAEGRNHD